MADTPPPRIPNTPGQEHLDAQIAGQRVSVNSQYLLPIGLVVIIGLGAFWLTRYLERIQVQQDHYLTNVVAEQRQIRELMELRLQGIRELVELRANSYVERQQDNLKHFHESQQELHRLSHAQTQTVLDAVRWLAHQLTLPIDQRQPLFNDPQWLRRDQQPQGTPP